MDRPHSGRETVFCHECENEWYRDEHGLACPQCHSDFIEIIDEGHDPRGDYADDQHSLPDPQPFDFSNIPDPEEDHINRLHFTPNPNGYSMRGVFTNTNLPNSFPAADSGPAQPGAPNAPPDQDRAAVANSFTSMMAGILGMQPQPAQTTMFPGGQTTTRTYNLGNGRITYTSASFSGRFPPPRDANRPQPGIPPVEDLNTVLSQLFSGLEGHPAPRGMGPPGVAQPSMGPPGVAQRGMGPPGVAQPGMGPPGVAQPGMGPANPLVSLLGFLFNPAGAQHGDAVYTQEALDRVISQLMEQNGMGNAPGPADPQEIADLPKIHVDKSMLGDNGKAECSICMDEVKLGDEVTKLYCTHWFHGQCVNAWLTEHDTCPHCRKGIRQAKEESQARSSTPIDTSASRRDHTRRRESGSSSHRRSSNADSGGSSNGGGFTDRMRSFFGRS